MVNYLLRFHADWFIKQSYSSHSSLGSTLCFHSNLHRSFLAEQHASVFSFLGDAAGWCLKEDMIQLVLLGSFGVYDIKHGASPIFHEFIMTFVGNVFFILGRIQTHVVNKSGSHVVQNKDVSSERVKHWRLNHSAILIVVFLSLFSEQSPWNPAEISDFYSVIEANQYFGLHPGDVIFFDQPVSWPWGDWKGNGRAVPPVISCRASSRYRVECRQSRCRLLWRLRMVMPAHDFGDKYVHKCWSRRCLCLLSIYTPGVYTGIFW